MFTFYAEGQTLYGNAAATMIGTSLAIQLILLIITHMKGGFTVILTEVAKLLSGMKPAFDAYAVGIGAERAEYAIFDPFIEVRACQAATNAIVSLLTHRFAPQRWSGRE